MVTSHDRFITLAAAAY